MAWDFPRIVFAVLLLPDLACSAPSCDLSLLRSYNRTADLAFRRKENDVLADARFHAFMSKILNLNINGCYLPSTDPDSVLYRTKQEEKSGMK